MNLTHLTKVNLLASCIVVAAGFLAGCGSTNSNNSYDTSSAEVAGEFIGGTASASDSSSTGSVVSLYKSSGQPSLFQSLKILASQPLESRASAASCTSSVMVDGSACGGGGSNVMTLNLGGCTGLLGSWSGTDTLTYGTAAACTTANGGGLDAMTNGQSVVMTSNGITLTSSGSFSVETDSTSSGYSTAESGGISVTCVGNCSSQRTVSILGVHRKLASPAGVTLFDHTFNTPTPFTITGVGGARTITAGSLQLQHNLAKFTAVATVASTITFSSTCCQPVGGSVTTTFTNGTKSGSETVTFGPSCGQATVNGNAVSLAYCQ